MLTSRTLEEKIAPIINPFVPSQNTGHIKGVGSGDVIAPRTIHRIHREGDIVLKVLRTESGRASSDCFYITDSAVEHVSLFLLRHSLRRHNFRKTFETRGLEP